MLRANLHHGLLLGSALLALQTLLSTAPVAAQDIDPRVDTETLLCSQMIVSTRAILAGTEAGSDVHQQVAQLLPDRDVLSVALQLRALENTGCDVPIEVVGEAAVEQMMSHSAPLLEAYERGETEVLRAAWVEMQPQLTACLADITEDDRARARHILETGNELACGYVIE